MARIHIDFHEPPCFTCELPVRITDINYGNHLAHDRLVSMLHEARVQFFEAHAMHETDIDGVGIIVSDLAVRYLAETFYAQTLKIEISLAEPNRSACDMQYRVTDSASGSPVALAKTGLVFYNYERKRVQAMPERFAQLFEN